MYKLVIVEDEDNIRHSLECFIPWEEIGFQVVSTFSDGSDALVYLREHPCDAVLTDILMSRMSGLEMIHSLHEIDPQIMVVILSGHSDFAYAQQAIEYKVMHYLVKPVDEDELIAVFRGLKAQLDDRQEELALADSQTKDLKQLLQRSFFRDLLSGRIALESELNVYIKLLGLQISKDSPLLSFDIVAKRHEPEDPQHELTDQSVEDVFRMRLAVDKTCHCFWFEERYDRWRVVFAGGSQRENGSLQKYANQIMQLLVDELNNRFSYVFAFRLTHSVTQLSELLSGVKTAIESNAAPQEQIVDEALYEAVVSGYKLLVIELDLGSKDTLIHILNGMLYDLKDAPVEDVQFILKNLYSLVELNYKKRKLNVWDLTNGKFNFIHLYRSEDMDVIANALKEDFCALCDGLKTKRRASEHTVVGHLVQYLNEHIEEDIPHDVIASRYRIHPGYLSRLFKQEMGETLSEYLLRIKIEKAAALLKTGQYKIGEIACMVGYSASSYFSSMFKKYTGYSPREYTQRIAL